jgi:hypothetical protein
MRERQTGVVRCFATTSVQCQSPATQGQGSKKRVIKEAKKKDDKLRHAINLYQMTEWFFPTTAGDSATASSSLLSPSAVPKKASTKKENQKDDLDEVLDDHIRSSILGSGTSASVSENFNKPVAMRNAYSALSDNAQRDRNQYSSIFESNSSSDEEPDTGLLTAIWPAKGPIWSSFARTEGETLPPIEDKEAVEKYVANTVKRAKAIASQDRTRPSSLDIRGAQVMDALYGTVAGNLPGLEVLKERVRERELKEKAQQQQMQKQEE